MQKHSGNEKGVWTLAIETQEIRSMLKTLNLYHTADKYDELLNMAIEGSLSYERFLDNILKSEIRGREDKKYEKRLKQAAFPEHKSIDGFDISEQPSLSEKQLNQLKELSWLSQGYNLILLGPPGVGKTHLAIGLGMFSIYNGYKAVFTQMNDLIYILKTAQISSVSKSKLKRISECDLLIIDDLMFMAMENYEANLFFQLVNKLYGQSSIIITSNKGPESWGELLGDQAITTAILDRIVHKCQVINLCGDSYRLKHRKSIFGNS